MNFNRNQLKTKVFLLLSLIFTILTFVGGYKIITNKVDNAGYSVVPMVFAVTFSTLYRNSKKNK